MFHHTISRMREYAYDWPIVQWFLLLPVQHNIAWIETALPVLELSIHVSFDCWTTTITTTQKKNSNRNQPKTMERKWVFSFNLLLNVKETTIQITNETRENNELCKRVSAVYENPTTHTVISWFTDNGHNTSLYSLSSLSLHEHNGAIEILCVSFPFQLSTISFSFAHITVTNDCHRSKINHFLCPFRSNLADRQSTFNVFGRTTEKGNKNIIIN